MSGESVSIDVLRIWNRNPKGSARFPEGNVMKMSVVVNGMSADAAEQELRGRKQRIWQKEGEPMREGGY